MIKKILLLGAIAVVGITAGLFSYTASADHNDDCGIEGRHYGHLFTMNEPRLWAHHTDPGYTGDTILCGSATDPDYSWKGVKGRMRIPSNTFPDEGTYNEDTDFIMNHYRVDFDNGDWVEVGMYLGPGWDGDGSYDCPQRVPGLLPAAGYGVCVESFDESTGKFRYHYLGPVDANLDNHFEISHYSSGYWRVYWNSTYKKQVYVGETVGSPLVGAEVYDSSCDVSNHCTNPPSLPTVGFGHPTTSAYKIQLKVGSSWDVWDSTYRDNTGSFDEQCGFNDAGDVETYDLIGSKAYYHLIARSYYDDDDC